MKDSDETRGLMMERQAICAGFDEFAAHEAAKSQQQLEDEEIAQLKGKSVKLELTPGGWQRAPEPGEQFTREEAIATLYGQEALDRLKSGGRVATRQMQELAQALAAGDDPDECDHQACSLSYICKFFKSGAV